MEIAAYYFHRRKRLEAIIDEHYEFDDLKNQVDMKRLRVHDSQGKEVICGNGKARKTC